MLNISKETDGMELTVKLEGRLDTTTAPMLEGELKLAVNGITSLVFDMTGLEYISSAGLRVLLSAQKVMSKQGGMIVKNANEDVMDVFEVTGFIEILTIE